MMVDTPGFTVPMPPSPLTQAMQAARPQDAQPQGLNGAFSPAMVPQPQGTGIPAPMAASFAQGDPDAMAMLGVRPQAGGATSDLGAFYRALTGGPDAVTKNVTNAAANLQQAAAAKKGKIQDAINAIQGWQNGNTTNMAQLAFAGGLLTPPTGPTGFTGELANGIKAALPVMQQQRQMSLETAKAVGQLGIAESDVDLQQAALAQEEVMKRYEMAQRALQTEAYAGARTDVAQIQAQARADAARIAASGHVTQAQINAFAKKYQVDTEQAAKMLAAEGAYLRGAGIEKHGEAAITAANAKAAGGGLTPAEQARMSGLAWHEASTSLDWMKAKDDATKLAILNRSRQARMLPPLTALPGNGPAAGTAPATPQPAPASPAAPAAPSATPRPSGADLFNAPIQ